VTVTKYCCLLFVVTHAPVVAALSFIAVAVVLALLCKFGKYVSQTVDIRDGDLYES
jgi:hypothetical protein